MQMAKITIEKLDRNVLDKEFDCGNSSINMQVQASYYPTLLQYAYAYKVSISDHIVGYYMIKLRTIKLEKAPSEISEYSCSLISECNAVHIKYIAIDKEYQHKTIGTYVLKTIIVSVLNLCKKFPITLITLDALIDKYDWYKRNGFRAFDEDELQVSQTTIPMYINCILDKKTVNDYCSI